MKESNDVHQLLFVAQYSYKVMDIIKDAKAALSIEEYEEFIKSCKKLIDEMG